MTNDQINKATIGANKDQLVMKANLQEEIDKVIKEFRKLDFHILDKDCLKCKPASIKDFIKIETFIHEKIKEIEDNYKKELIKEIEKEIKEESNLEILTGLSVALEIIK